MNIQTITEMSMTIQRRVQWLAEEHAEHLRAGNHQLAQQCIGGIAAMVSLAQDMELEGAVLFAATELNRCRLAIPFQVDILTANNKPVSLTAA